MGNEIQEYPKAMHGPKGAYRVVKSAEEEKELGEGWLSGHQHWAAKNASEPRKPVVTQKTKAIQ